MYNEKHERLTINQSKVELGIVFYYIDVGRLRHIFRNHEFFILLVENFSGRYKTLASLDPNTRFTQKNLLIVEHRAALETLYTNLLFTYMYPGLSPGQFW